MSAHVWEALLQRLGLEERKIWEAQVDKIEFKPDKKAIAAELKRGSRDSGRRLEVRRVALGDHVGGKCFVTIMKAERLTGIRFASCG